MTTGITWTEETWNPIVGCSIVSKGCTNCYAMQWAGQRMDGNPKSPHYADTTQQVNGNHVWTGKLTRAPEATLLKPLRWTRPRMIFVNSMSDLFHEAVPDEWIDQVFAVMALTPQHTYQILTKRPERMKAYMTACPAVRLADQMRTLGKIPENRGILLRTTNGRLPNVWLGVSVEDQATADERIPLLLETPAAVRWISAEPLLGPIDIRTIAMPASWPKCECTDFPTTINALDATVYCAGCCEGSESMDCGRIDWVVAGGESGRDARPMHPDWVRSLRDQCADAEVPFFFKQWGEWAPQDLWSPASRRPQMAIDLVGKPVPHDIAPQDVGGHRFILSGKKAAGDRLDGVQHHNWPVKEAK